MTDITVPVPDDRAAEFYQFFGLWLAGSLSLQADPARSPGSHPETPDSPGQERQSWGSTEADLVDAVTLWKKFSPRARAMFSLLIDNPGKEFTGPQIAKECNIPNGAHGVAGVLAWPGRHGWTLGRKLPSSYREDSETLEGFYWMSEERSALFKAAREQAEGAA